MPSATGDRYPIPDLNDQNSQLALADIEKDPKVAYPQAIGTHPTHSTNPTERIVRELADLVEDSSGNAPVEFPELACRRI